MPAPVKAKRKKHTPKQKPLLSNYPYTVLITLGALSLSLFVMVNQAQKNQEQRTRAQTTNCTVSAADLAIDTEEQKMLLLLNSYRKEKDAPELKLSPNLIRSASWMSRDMATRKILNHTDSLKRNPSKRTQECGASYGAENIAFGNNDAEGTITRWKNSPGHNFNMLDPKYTVVGIARSGVYWTQVFAQKDEVSSVTPKQTTPTTEVPNPECLGACVTEAPDAITAPPSTTHKTTPDPRENTNGEDINIGDNNAEGTAGIIALFLSFLKAILEAFLSIFK